MATPTKARPAYTWKIEASGWRPQKKGDSLQGFLTLKLPPGMCLYDCTCHRRADGTRWIGLPDRCAETIILSRSGWLQ
jgi:hypothetical protein